MTIDYRQIAAFLSNGRIMCDMIARITARQRCVSTPYVSYHSNRTSEKNLSRSLHEIFGASFRFRSKMTRTAPPRKRFRTPVSLSASSTWESRFNDEATASLTSRSVRADTAIDHQLPRVFLAAPCSSRLTHMVAAPFRILFCSVIATSCVAAADESQIRLPLWPSGAPGSEARKDEPESVDRGAGWCNVSNVHHPSITPFLPEVEATTSKPTATTAIIIAPGGGHRKLCLGHEGDALAEWFAKQGVAAFVLRYRLAREEGSQYTVDEHAMADTRRAIRTVRSKADEWNIDPHRIGILGFSAGGELAALAAMANDAGRTNATDPIERISCRPDFQGLIYPGSSSRFTVETGMPPAFIALGQNDRDDIAIGMADLYLKYRAAKVPCELHIYSNAGHGFGYRPGTTTAAGDWPNRMLEWLRDSDLLESRGEK